MCDSIWLNSSYKQKYFRQNRIENQNIRFIYEVYSADWGSVVVKALRYKSEGSGIDCRCHRGFFPWHLTVPCALGSTQPLKMSTRLILEVKAAGT